MKSHYQTKHLVRQLGRRGQGNYSLGRGAGSSANNQLPEPTQLDGRKANRQLHKSLDQLFNDGASLILETDRGWDDEGGNCFEAYILMKEWTADFFDNSINSDDQLYSMRYIVEHPDRFWLLWSGPY